MLSTNKVVGATRLVQKLAEVAFRKTPVDISCCVAKSWQYVFCNLVVIVLQMETPNTTQNTYHFVTYVVRKHEKEICGWWKDMDGNGPVFPSQVQQQRQA